MVRSYRDLKVWEKSMDLVVESYRVSRLLPKAEMFGLISQIQRAAVSVPANIAEGHGREHMGDYLRHLSIASGSLHGDSRLIMLFAITTCTIYTTIPSEMDEGVVEVKRMLAHSGTWCKREAGWKNAIGDQLTKRLKEVPVAA